MDSFPPEDQLTSPAESTPSPKPSLSARRILRVLKICLALVAVALVAVIVFALRLRHDMRSALPQLDGTIHIAGLQAAVSITRDAQGVPSLRVTSLNDLLFAQGYVTAQDRLWQMDALRRHAAGELAEVLGPSLLDHDKQQRTLQLRATADTAFAALPTDQKAQLEAYARGVNAFIDTHADSLPVEFAFLHYKPAPWQPRDSLLVVLTMWQSLSTEFPRKLEREALMRHLPASLADDLYPVGSFRDHPPTTPPTDLTTPVDEVEQIPLDSSQSSLVPPQELLRREQALGLSRCEGCRAGSNNWAVPASQSASGAPLLSNDMHLGLSVPDIWYEASLHISSAMQPFDVAGFTLPGVPFVIVGRNAHVAWGFTNLGGDTQDLYIEHTRGSGVALEYQRPDGSWTQAEHHTEQIHVRLGRDVTLDVVTTQHTLGAKMLPTPIVSPLYPGETRSLSLAWTAYDPAALALPLLALNSAASGAELVAASATFGGPSLNLVYADDAHHIGYHALGYIPVRGPAEHHPRAPLLNGLPEASPVPEDEQDESAEPEARLHLPAHEEPADWSTQSGRPHMLEAAFLPMQRARHGRLHREIPVHRPAARKAQPRVVPEATPEQATIAPRPPQIDYTIGSPIASVPVDALDASQQWSGYVPYEELPSIVDPPFGVLATANARVTPDDYPYHLANDWADPYRVERIHHLLDRRRGLTPADMLATQLDIRSALDLLVAQRLAYAVDHANAKTLSSDAKRLHAAADILRSWKGDLTTDAVAPTIVAAVRPLLMPTLIAAQIRAHDHLGAHDEHARELTQLYAWETSGTALELILNRRPTRWLPAGFANWDDFLATMLESGLHSSSAPRDLSRWTYGSVHVATIDHPLFKSGSHLGHLLGVPANAPVHPMPGDAVTIRASGRSFGPSERFTADLSSPDASTANITTGESGNPASPNYLDQYLPWLRGTTFAFPLHTLAARHTLTLEP